MDKVLESLRAVAATTPRRWLDLTHTLPADLLLMPPAQGEWSPVECLQHIVDTEKVLQFRLQAFLDGRDFPDFNPAADGTRSGTSTPLDLAETFARLRAESMLMLEKLMEADLQRKVRHAELGLVTLGEMVHHWAAHDLNHTVQAERALLQPFIRGCGPWDRYYTDHTITG